MFKSMGLDEQTAGIMASVTFGLLMIAASAKGFKEGAKHFKKVKDSVSPEKILLMTREAAAKIRVASSAAGAGFQIAKIGADVPAGIAGYHAGMARAEKSKLEAEASQISYNLKADSELIKTMNEVYVSRYEKISDILSSDRLSRKFINRNINA